MVDGSQPTRSVEAAAFLLFLIAVSAAFGLSIAPYAGAILWGIVAAIMFLPLCDRLAARLKKGRGSAAGIVLLIIVVLVIVPAVLIGNYVIGEVAGLYDRLRTNQTDLDQLLTTIAARLPQWVLGLLHRAGIDDPSSLKEKLGTQIAGQVRPMVGKVVGVGQQVAGFLMSLVVMLYLTYFLLRDGRELNDQVGSAVPIEARIRHQLAERFLTVVRATIKGSVVVGAAQGAIGGVIMWALGVPNALFWGVVMALSSLIPAVGTGLVWAPAAIYLAIKGDVWQAVVMALSGLFVIGSVDNVLKPILVGRETKMPDFLVLISTLGGIEAFGFNGLLLGPLSAAMFITGWDIFRRERSGAEKVG